RRCPPLPGRGGELRRGRSGALRRGQEPAGEGAHPRRSHRGRRGLERGPRRRPAGVCVMDPSLVAVVREIEAHASSLGWDRPEQLFALVPTADLVAAEPELATALGIAPDEAEGWTPIEQEPLPAHQMLEQVLPTIVWPASVAGVAAVAERLVLPPEADAAMPEDPVEAQEYAAQHPDRQEVRMVAAVLREGGT